MAAKKKSKRMTIKKTARKIAKKVQRSIAKKNVSTHARATTKTTKKRLKKPARKRSKKTFALLDCPSKHEACKKDPKGECIYDKHASIQPHKCGSCKLNY